MPVEPSDPVVNSLIERLPRRERRGLLTDSTLMELTVGDILCEPDQPYRHAYFPLTGIISLVATLRDEQPFNIGMIGNEGMLGATLVLGIGNAPLCGIVQGAGTSLRISALNLRRRLRDRPGLARALNRYLYVSMAQLSRTAVCTRFHEVEARLVRWLLMTHDRVQTDNFHITHQSLADVLGVRRSAVTIAAGALQKKGLVRYARGNITVLSRRGLETASCECYAAVVDDYCRLLP
ncbi:MAG: Crp/Fnr family transcriptional regulator [Gammaproteobacteria bacterium]|nr:Crp/Fnr family transcriptional regulator [Gammaproteobacteria bacterium]